MNGLDAVLLVALAVGAISGYRRGLVLQACSYAGLLLGLVAGAAAAPLVARIVGDGGPRVAAATVSLLLLAALGNGLGWIAGSILRGRMRRGPLAFLDGPGGAAVSVLAMAIAIWFVSLNLVGGPWPAVSREIRGSALVRSLDESLPEPPSLVAQVRGFLDRYGFPDVFSGIPPIPAEPVRPPTTVEARTAFASASGSVVRIVGAACDRIQEGSGFVVAEDYVLTNAHVVAGVRKTQVERADSPTRSGTVVGFDPELDLALLYVRDAPPPLDLAAGVVDAASVGSVLGYPNGGPLRGDGAAVGRYIEAAVGRDIYGRRGAEREVYELQTTVRPGNSGGPFVLVDGRVAGVVFAASRTDDGIGYAIASTEVLPWLAEVLGRETAVPTGACLSG
ncbi:MAG: MarP family serine protease [Actinomycetota bacterium]